MHGDPTAAVVEVSDDEVDVDTTAATQTGPPPPSLRAMMETIMMTQSTHGQVLYGLLGDIAALRVDVANFRRQKVADLSSSPSARLIDGILLTKFDTIDDKVGATVSMVYISGAPVMFVGCGQSYTHLKKLKVKSIVKTLLN
ncbi:signal recognition particle receptor subunit alpha like protein [Quercus suber]|uniref:Signal recognition particle receptor subunit alpha like protein n=1 Tax=Quercus suber TaxID=58331 RepID=A0AAW0LZN8_QUESU